MSFLSADFFVFFAIVLLLYYLLPKRFQWMVLLAASYGFYLYAGIRTIAYVLFTTLSAFLCARFIASVRSAYETRVGDAAQPVSREEKSALQKRMQRKSRLILSLCLLLNLGVLVVLKYLNFAIESVNALLPRLGAGAIPTVSLLVPLGVSFYTFQSMGYVIDVCRGKVEAARSLPRFALFVSFFPQIVQGPINAYGKLAPQLTEAHPFDYVKFTQGIQLIVWGAFKKLVIADRLAIIVNPILSDMGAITSPRAFLAIILYSFQIYTDFSGGIDVALGAAQSMGIDMETNFLRPYFAKTIPEFWRRWHITMGNWMREYIFYPLAISKAFGRMAKRLRKAFGPFIAKTLPICVASVITYLAVGLWHGANWTFIVYGLYNGALVTLGTLCKPLTDKGTALLKLDTDTFGFRLFQMIRTFLLVCVGRCFSRLDTVANGLLVCKRFLTAFLRPGSLLLFLRDDLLSLGLDAPSLVVLALALLVLLTASILQERGVHIRETLARQNLPFRWLVYLGGFIIVVVFGVYGAGYDASTFIYKGF